MSLANKTVGFWGAMNVIFNNVFAGRCLIVLYVAIDKSLLFIADVQDLFYNCGPYFHGGIIRVRH